MVGQWAGAVYSSNGVSLMGRDLIRQSARIPSATAAPTTPAPASVVDTYFVPAVIAIIVVVIIGFAVLFLALRKRP